MIYRYGGFLAGEKERVSVEKNGLMDLQGAPKVRLVYEFCTFIIYFHHFFNIFMLIFFSIKDLRGGIIHLYEKEKIEYEIAK